MIFVDASRYNNTAKGTGVENYSVNLINALVKLAPREITLVSPRKIPLDVSQLIIPFPRLWTQVRLSWEVWRRRVSSRAKSMDLQPIQTLFIPSHLMPLVHPKNTIITIHDVAFKRFPECYSWASRWYLDWGARFAVKHAKTIIVPSQVTKDDLIEFYKADPQKIVVIPHGYTLLGHPRESGDLDSRLHGNDRGQQKYFLFIGRIERKKNLLTLIKAFEIFSQKHTDFKLVLAGKPGVGGDEIMKTAKSNTNIILTGYVDESTKVVLLKNAFAFVLPSLYEGFGFPILEAMQFGLPLIISDIPASREIAGENARFFDPKDMNGLARLLGKYAEKRPAFSGEYQKILQKYSWDECAKKTWNVLTHLELPIP